MLYVAKKEVVKQAKASLSLLDWASNGTEKSKKSSKKAKEPEATTGASDQEMQANFQANLTKAKEAAENTKVAMTLAANKMFAFYANLLLVRQSMRGTRSLKSRWKATNMLIFKASCRKAQGECHVSCLTIVWCFTFSPCSPSTQLSTKILHHQCTKEAPVCQCVPVCMSCRAAQRLHCADAVLLQQPQLQHHDQVGESSVHGGWNRESHVLRMCWIQW